MLGVGGIYPLPVAPAQGKGPRHAEGVVLVGYKPGTSQAARAHARQSVGALRASPLSRLAVDAEKIVLPPGKPVAVAIKALPRDTGHRRR